MDLLAITDALAAKYATLPAPAGEDLAMQGATGRAPNDISTTPYVVVTASVESPATFPVRSANTRGGAIPFNVDFFLERSDDLPHQMIRLQRWVPSLCDALLTGTQLGLAPPVASSWLESFQIGDIAYGNPATRWAGVRIIAIVRVSEAVVYTA
jgi:hypothetical protein